MGVQVPHSVSLDTIVGEGLLVTMVWEWEFRLSIKPLLIPSGWKRQKCLISAPHMASTDIIGGGGISLEGTMLQLKLQYFGYLMRRVDSLEKTLMLGGIGGKRRRG